MKTQLLIFAIILFTVNSHAQKTQYFLEGGVDYSDVRSFGLIDPTSSGFASPISAQFSLKKNGGFHLDGSIVFPFSKYFSIKTGLGLKVMNFANENNRQTAGMLYFAGTTPQILYNDRQPFLVPNSVIQINDSTYIENPDYTGLDLLDSTLVDTTYIKHLPRKPFATSNSQYRMLVANIPIEIQARFFDEKLLVSSGVVFCGIVYAHNKETDDVLHISNSYNARTKFYETEYLNFRISLNYKVYKNMYAGMTYSLSTLQFYSMSSLREYSLNVSYKF